MTAFLINALFLIAVLGVPLILTRLFVSKMYNRCRGCGTLNARRRTHCRNCGAELYAGLADR